MRKKKGEYREPLYEFLVTQEAVAATDFENRACPFCGGLKISRLTSRNVAGCEWIECDTCGATGPNTKKATIGWNIRCDERGISGPREILIDFMNLKTEPAP